MARAQRQGDCSSHSSQHLCYIKCNFEMHMKVTSSHNKRLDGHLAYAIATTCFTRTQLLEHPHVRQHKLGSYTVNLLSISGKIFPLLQNPFKTSFPQAFQRLYVYYIPAVTMNWYRLLPYIGHLHSS